MTAEFGATRPAFAGRYTEINLKIEKFERQFHSLPGIKGQVERSVLINQIIDSERRNDYFRHLRERPISEKMVDPHSEYFDPLRSALWHWRKSNDDEAYWLVFLFVYFGKHRVSGWRFIREVYGRLGTTPHWNWHEITHGTPEFRLWLKDHFEVLTRRDEPRGFGNHRKYASLKPDSARGAAAVFESYVEWIMPHGNHAELFGSLLSDSPQGSFDVVYKSMDVVIDFGRIARFDYLMTLSRLEMLDVLPPHMYLKEATGPLRGSQLLAGGPGGHATAAQLEEELAEFSAYVGVGPDVLEDAVCNWQKSPSYFKTFVL